jgi:hypothetical protein
MDHWLKCTSQSEENLILTLRFEELMARLKQGPEDTMEFKKYMSLTADREHLHHELERELNDVSTEYDPENRDTFLLKNAKLSDYERKSLKTELTGITGDVDKYGERIALGLRFVRALELDFKMIERYCLIGQRFRDVVNRFKILGDWMKKYGWLWYVDWRNYVNIDLAFGYKEAVVMGKDYNDLQDWVNKYREHRAPISGDQNFGFLKMFASSLSTLVLGTARDDLARSSSISDKEFDPMKLEDGSLKYGFVMDNPGIIGYRTWLDKRDWARGGSSSVKMHKSAIVRGREIRLAETKNTVAHYADMDVLYKTSLERDRCQYGKSIQKLERGKVRYVLGMDLETYLLMSYIDIYIDQLLRGVSWSTLFMGSNAKLGLDIRRCIDTRDKRGWNVPIDQSGFDHSINLPMVKIALLVICELLQSRKVWNDEIEKIMRLIIRRLTEEEYSGHIVSSDGRRIKVRNGVLSGWKWTALIDTFVNAGELGVVRQILRLYGWQDCVRHWNAQGDDDDILVSDVGYAIAMCETYRFCGMDINPGKFFISKYVNEYLRKTYERGIVSGYAARMITTFTIINPIRSRPLSQLQEINALVSNYSDLYRRSGFKQRILDMLVLEIAGRFWRWGRRYSYVVASSMLDSIIPRNLIRVDTKKEVPRSERFLRYKLSLDEYIEIDEKLIDWVGGNGLGKVPQKRVAIMVPSNYGKTTAAKGWPELFFDIDEILIRKQLFPHKRHAGESKYWVSLTEAQRKCLKSSLRAIYQPIILCHSPGQVEGLVSQIFKYLPKRRELPGGARSNMNYDYLNSETTYIDLCENGDYIDGNTIAKKLGIRSQKIDFCLGIGLQFLSAKWFDARGVDLEVIKSRVRSANESRFMSMITRHVINLRSSNIDRLTTSDIRDMLSTECFLGGFGLNREIVCAGNRKYQSRKIVLHERVIEPEIRYPRSDWAETIKDNIESRFGKRPLLKGLEQSTQSTNKSFKVVGHLYISRPIDRVRIVKKMRMSAHRFVSMLIAGRERSFREGDARPKLNADFAKDRYLAEGTMEVLEKLGKKELIDQIPLIFLNSGKILQIFKRNEFRLSKDWLFDRLKIKVPVNLRCRADIPGIVTRMAVNDYIVDAEFGTYNGLYGLMKYIERSYIPDVIALLERNKIKIIQ